MSSSPLPPPYEEATDISRFDNLLTYASTRGTYLLEDSLFKIFEMSYSNSQTLNLSLSEMTTPIAAQNIRATRRLRSLQILNLQLANETYRQIVTPHVLQRIHQEHYPGQRDSPSPMRISTPPQSITRRYTPSIPTAQPPTRTRANLHRRCHKCRSFSHLKRHCPQYRCLTCRNLQPGHLTNECPNQPMTSDHEYDFGHDYDPDGNLNGEQ